MLQARANRIGNVPHYCTLIPGDGIGPEVAQATVRAVEATGVDICWRRAELNEAIILESGKTLPQYLLDSLNETRVGLKGPVTTPIGGGFQSVNVALRKALDQLGWKYKHAEAGVEVRGWRGQTTKAEIAIDMGKYDVGVVKQEDGNALNAIPPIFHSIEGLFKKSPGEAFSYFTGGRVYSFASEKGLERAITDIGKDLNSQYLLSYNPNDKNEPGFHNIKVIVDRPGLVIRTRPGYWWGGGTQ